jgi:hypothetical protein
MIYSSVCLLRFVWSFPRARLQFTLDQCKGATSSPVQDVRLKVLLLQCKRNLAFSSKPAAMARSDSQPVACSS